MFHLSHSVVEVPNTHNFCRSEEGLSYNAYQNYFWYGPIPDPLRNMAVLNIWCMIKT